MSRDEWRAVAITGAGIFAVGFLSMWAILEAM